MLYHHLFGTGNILKYFLINHVPAIGFAPRLCRLIPDSRHDSWHERQGKKNKKKTHCPSFSLVSITLVSGCEEVRRRRRSWRQDLAQDIFAPPRQSDWQVGDMLMLRSATHSGREVAGWRGGPGGNSVHTHACTLIRLSEANQIHTCL